MPTSPIVPSLEVEIKRHGRGDYGVSVDGEYLGSARTHDEALAKANAYKWEILKRQPHITATA